MMAFHLRAYITNLLFFLPLAAFSQTTGQQSLIDSLSRYWKVDSIGIKDVKGKFAAPLSIKDNFMFFKNDGTFSAQDNGIVIKGKWKVDLQKRQLISFEIDNPELKEGIIFNIIGITEKKLAISSNPMSGNQIILYYIVNPI